MKDFAPLMKFEKKSLTIFALAVTVAQNVTSLKFSHSLWSPIHPVSTGLFLP